MAQIPTAEEFANTHHPMKTYPVDWNIMIEFAKLHVEAALKAASEKSYVEYIDLETKEDVITDDGVGVDINKNSILNSYPLENIK
jgi:hypothetical protein